MNFEESLKKHLTSNPALVDLTGNRWYPSVAPEGVSVPYGVYELISGPYDETLSGMTDHAVHQYQFSIFGSTRSSIVQVGAKLKESFKIIPMPLGGVGGIEIQSISLISNTNSYEYETKEYRKNMDFEFHFEEV